MLAEQRALLWLCESADASFINHQFGPLVCSSNFDWLNFFQLANRHGLVPLAYRNGSQLLIDIIPADIMERLKNRYQQIAQRNLQLTAECVRLNKLCADNQVPISFIKGTALAIQLYNDPTLRIYSDIDAFVDKKYHSTILPALKAYGGKFKHEFTPKQFKYQLKYFKDLPIRLESSNALFEMHWHYSYNPRVLKKLNQHQQRYSKSIQWNKVELTTLEPHAHCCYLAFHGSLHGWSCYKWLTDFYHCLRLCDLKTLLPLSHAFNVPHHVKHAILLCQEIFTVDNHYILEPNQQTRSDVKAYQIMKNILFESQHSNNFTVRLEKFQLFWHLSAKKIFWLHKLIHSTRHGFEIWSKHPLPPSLFFLYRFIRPFDWVDRFMIKPIRRNKT
ncbi:MAG: nucleotidyltransferase family protein [Coxiellaceae bacterium]|nr:nucleotidyltransferase family protein [Coxiellaceae bacterium]